jgi:transposase
MPWKETQKMERRIEFAMRPVGAESIIEVCQEYGISRKTGCEWRERFVAEGLAANWGSQTANWGQAEKCYHWLTDPETPLY